MRAMPRDTKAHTTMRILIAEDDSIPADGLVRSFRQSGYAVDHVKHGIEADTALTLQPFDLLILDLGLPLIPWLEVLRCLRAHNSQMPVLILTAADSVDERVKELDLGTDDYIAKPFTQSQSTRACAHASWRGRRTDRSQTWLAVVRSGRAHRNHRRTGHRSVGVLEVLLQRTGRLGWYRRNSSSIICASGARKSAITPSRSTCIDLRASTEEEDRAGRREDHHGTRTRLHAGESVERSGYGSASIKIVSTAHSRRTKSAQALSNSDAKPFRPARRT